MPGFEVQYAKSNRSKCRGCGKPIAQESLRIGHLVPSPHFDGEQQNWYHHSCFWTKMTIPDVNLVKGLMDLKPDDIKTIKQKIGGTTNSPSNKSNNSQSSSSQSSSSQSDSSSSSSSSQSDSSSSSSSSQSDSSSSSSSSVSLIVDPSILPPASVSGDSYQVEYAKSNRSKCVGCSKPIAQESIRVGKMVRSDKFDGLIPRWYHQNCVFEHEAIWSPACVSGLLDLKPDDRIEITKSIHKFSVAPKITEPATAAAAAGSGNEKSSGTKSGNKKSEAKKKKRKTKRDSSDADEEEEEEEAAGEEEGDEETSKSKSKSKKKLKAESNTQAEDASEEEETQIDYSSMTVAELKYLLKEKGLPVNGKKAELVERLKQENEKEKEQEKDEEEKEAEAEEEEEEEEEEKEEKEESNKSTNKASDMEIDSSSSPEGELEKEASVRWEVKSKLGDISNATLKSILELNHLSTKGGRSDLINRAVEGLLYGQFPACPDCNSHSLHYSEEEGDYQCHHLLDWGKCQFHSLDVKRTKFILPDPDENSEIGSNSYLSKYKWKAQTKPIKAYQAIAAKKKSYLEATAAAAKEHDKRVQEQQKELEAARAAASLFDGLIFCVFDKGLSMKQQQVIAKIIGAGGTHQKDPTGADLVIHTHIFTHTQITD